MVIHLITKAAMKQDARRRELRGWGAKKRERHAKIVLKHVECGMLDSVAPQGAGLVVMQKTDDYFNLRNRSRHAPLA